MAGPRLRRRRQPCAGQTAATQRRRMFALELTQMAQRVAAVDAAIADPERSGRQIAPAAAATAISRRRSTPAIRQSRCAPLLERCSAGRRRAPVPARRTPAPIRRKPRPLPPPRAGCASTRSILVAKALDSVAVNEATLSVPWDDSRATAEPLRPGPVGEYLEVVDIDPASEHASTIPSTSTTRRSSRRTACRRPKAIRKFHQQMVYAVAHEDDRPSSSGRSAARACGRRTDAERRARRRLESRATRCRGCASTRTPCAPTTPITARQEGAAVRLFPGREQGRRHDDGRARWCSPACPATSSRTRRRTPCSTACTAASRKPPTPTCRPSTRPSPTSSRCSSISP